MMLVFFILRASIARVTKDGRAEFGLFSSLLKLGINRAQFRYVGQQTAPQKN